MFFHTNSPQFFHVDHPLLSQGRGQRSVERSGAGHREEDAWTSGTVQWMGSTGKVLTGNHGFDSLHMVSLGENIGNIFPKTMV
jgi:hypothetical protein